MRKHFIVDVRRSFLSQDVIFFKANKKGYTSNMNQAGLYTLEEVEKIVHDINVYDLVAFTLEDIKSFFPHNE